MAGLFNPPRKGTFFILALISFFGVFLGCGSREAGQGGIGGRVTDINGNALEGVVIFSESTGNPTQSDGGGQFVLTSLPKGFHTLVARKTFFNDEKIQVELQDHVFIDNLHFRLTPFSKDAEVFEVRVKNLESRKAEITFRSNTSALSRVEFGTSQSFDSITESTSGFAKEHSHFLQPLLPGTTYFYRVRIEDQEKRQRNSSTFTLTTPLDDQPQTPQSFRFLPPQSFNSLTLAWDPVQFTGFQGYKVSRRLKGTEEFKEISGLLASSTYTDLNLKGGLSYQYRVNSFSREFGISSPTPIISALVMGTLSEIVQWDKENSPYILSGDLFLENGAIWDIQAGTEIIVATDTLRTGNVNPEKVQIDIRGSLNIWGDSLNPVKIHGMAFPGTPTLRDHWNGIHFSGTGQGVSKINYLEMADFGTQGIFSDGTTLIIDHLSLKHGQSGVKLINSIAQAALTTRISNSTFTDLTDTGIRLENIFETLLKGNHLTGNFRPILGIGLNTMTLEDNHLSTPQNTASMTVDTLFLTNNLFDISQSLALSIKGSDIIALQNTVVAKSGMLLIDHNSSTIENNIFTTLLPTGDVGVAFTRSFAVATNTLPNLRYNDIHNFTTRTINLTEGDGAYDIKPDFKLEEPNFFDLFPGSPLRFLGRKNDRLGVIFK